MFEGIKRQIRAVQYGDVAIRRRWFFVCVVGLFSLVVIGWVVYGVRHGSFGVGVGASVHNAKSAWESFLNDLRNAVNNE